MLIVSIISLFVFYDFVKKITKNEKIALIGLGLLAICPWHILQSIWELDCNMFPHFLLIAMDILYTGIIKNNKMIMYVSMFFYALTLYCYGVAIYFVPIFLLVFCVYLLKNKIINYKDIIICVVIFGLFAMPIVLMFAINLLHINTEIKILNITIPYYTNLSRTQDMVFFADNKLLKLIENILSTIMVIFNQLDTGEWNASPAFGTIYHISIIFIFISIIKITKISKKEKRISTENFLILIWLGISILTGFVINEVNINRLNSIWYVLLLLTGNGIYLIYEEFKYKKAYATTIICIYTILFSCYNIYFHTYYSKVIDMSGVFSEGFYQALSYVKDTDKKQVFYDNTKDDGNIDLYVEFNHDENKNYSVIIGEENIKSKLENLTEDEIIIIYTKLRDYPTELNVYEIENYKIIYK